MHKLLNDCYIVLLVSEQAVPIGDNIYLSKNDKEPLTSYASEALILSKEYYYYIGLILLYYYLFYFIVNCCIC